MPSGEVSFEAVFAPLSRRAADLSDAGLSFLSSMLPADCTLETMPVATLYRLHIVATANFRAALICLASPETSMGALPLLRGLLEVGSPPDEFEEAEE